MPRAPSSLQTELRQSRPFASLQDEAGVGLLRTADVVRRRVAKVIEPAGITLQQYNVLRILRGAGPEGLPTLEIGARLIEQTPGTTRLVDCLERQGMVARERGVEDRRVVRCRITQEGLRLLDRLDQPLRELSRSVVGGLSQAQLRTLIHLLELVRAG